MKSSEDGGMKDSDEKEVEKLLDDPSSTLEELTFRWRLMPPDERYWPRDLYERLAARFLESKAFLLCHDVAAAGVKRYLQDRSLLLLQGRALERSGAAVRAHDIAVKLRAQDDKAEIGAPAGNGTEFTGTAGGDADARESETLGFLGQTLADLALTTGDEAKRLGYRQESFEAFSRAYALSNDFDYGINAAAHLVALGRRPEAEEMARCVRACCVALLASESPPRYRIHAAMGEAALILGETDEAVRCYQEAEKSPQRDLAAAVATRRQARDLMKNLVGTTDRTGEIRAKIEKCFAVPNVAVVVGHMIDRKDRLVPRFPERIADDLALEMEKRIVARGIRIGYSSAACGTDIIFQEILKSRGCERYVVLPYEREQFRHDCVAYPGDHWSKRFDDVLEGAEVIYVSPHQSISQSAVSYEYACCVLTGMAKARADQLDTDLIPLCVWNEEPGDGSGGTSWIANRWKEHRRGIEIIRPSTTPWRGPLDGLAPIPPPLRRTSPRKPRSEGATEVVSILFADVQNFTQLTEEQMPAFVEHFFYMVGAMAAISGDRPIVQESRGDGIFFVFKHPAEAGRFALALRDRILRTDWAAHGLPKNFNARMALHAGPTYHYLCPFTKRQTYTGHHVNRAARIEPITPPGEVFASREFAALALEDDVHDFVCEYAGLSVLHKSYETQPVYLVRPAPGHG
jgi:class 3 adenylate cyclase/tetratricopeptide (TPR) repeat protein